MSKLTLSKKQISIQRPAVCLARSRFFTLLELLVVIGIIGILAALILVGLGGGNEASKKTKAKAEMASIVTAYMDNEHTGTTLPTSLGKDPWGTNYIAPVKNTDFEQWRMYSNGPDGDITGTPGTVAYDYDAPANRDNIYSWKD